MSWLGPKRQPSLGGEWFNRAASQKSQEQKEIGCWIGESNFGRCGCDSFLVQQCTRRNFFQCVCDLVLVVSGATTHSSMRETKNDSHRYAAATKEGANKGKQVGGSSNQDSTFASVINDGLSLFGVFDGHGENGGSVSSFVAQKLPFEVGRLGKSICCSPTPCHATIRE